MICSMDNGWTEAATTTHQDHVIAHVIDTTVLGYLVLEDAIHLLLDIGFIWKIYVDAEMGLLPHPVAMAELEVEAELLTQLKVDVDLLLKGGGARGLARFTPIRDSFPITAAQPFVRGDEYKLLLEGETQMIQITTSMKEASFEVTEGPKS